MFVSMRLLRVDYHGLASVATTRKADNGLRRQLARYDISVPFFHVPSNGITYQMPLRIFLVTNIFEKKKKKKKKRYPWDGIDTFEANKRGMIGEKITIILRIRIGYHYNNDIIQASFKIMMHPKIKESLYKKEISKDNNLNYIIK